VAKPTGAPPATACASSPAKRARSSVATFRPSITVALIPPAVWRIGAAGDHSFVTVGGVDVSADLQELVERRGALRARMLELRSESPEDHDGFLRTVDQLLAVSKRASGHGDGSDGERSDGDRSDGDRGDAD
jgi:hypothetical protein